MTTPDPSLYEKAASIIESTGRLAHGAYAETVTGDGDRPRVLCYCTVGAINVAAGREAEDFGNDREEFRLLALKLFPAEDVDRNVEHYASNVIPIWNDDGTTAAEATALLREFAAELRAAA